MGYTFQTYILKEKGSQNINLNMGCWEKGKGTQYFESIGENFENLHVNKRIEKRDILGQSVPPEEKKLLVRD